MANQLTDFPIKNDIQIDDNFTDEQVCQAECPSVYTIFFYECKNAAGVGIGIIIMTLEMEMITSS